MKPSPAIPDFCPACNATGEPFVVIHRETEQEFRGEALRVTSPALRCRHCGFGLLGPGHLDALRLATHDAYRRGHGLLSTAEMTARRKAMGLSQKRFAEYLSVGSASIERWEAGTLVQDKASDLLVRQRTDHTRFLAGHQTPTRTDKTVFNHAPAQAPAADSPAAQTTADFQFSSQTAHTSPAQPHPNPRHALIPAA